MNTNCLLRFSKILVVIFTLLVFAGAYSNPDINNDIDGKWYLEINIGGIGILRTVMNFETKTVNNDNSIEIKFNAYTREGAVKDFTDIYSSPMAAMLSRIPNGSIIKIDRGETLSDNGKINIQGSFVSLAGNFNLEGNINEDLIIGNLKRKDKSIAGVINGYRITPDKVPLLSDYTAIINTIIDTTEKNIFSADMIATDKWKDFKSHIASASKFIHDDAELAFAFFYFADGLPFSHFHLTRDLNRSNSVLENLSGETKDTMNVVYEMKDYEKNTCYLKINSFSGSSQEIDSLFKIINDKGYDNLIIDLRNNRGGSLSAGLRTAQYLIKEELNGGIFLTRKWFDSERKIPVPDDYKNFPSISEANQELLTQNIHDYEAVTMTSKPLANRFKGKVYILTSKITGSTCEPLVYGLKQSGTAVIIGEKTAGAMLSGEKFSVGDEFFLTIPTADFYTSDGIRLDGVGVTPDIEVNPKDALEYVLKLPK